METSVIVKKTEKQILKDKKAWIKSLRIWRKVSKRVRIIKDGDQYVVQGRNYVGLFKGWGEWFDLNTFSSIKQAIRQKNMRVVVVVMRDMPFRNEFVRRRKLKRKLRIGY